eukprot:1021171-Amphidinium_carterae.3
MFGTVVLEPRQRIPGIGESEGAGDKSVYSWELCRVSRSFVSITQRKAKAWAKGTRRVRRQKPLVGLFWLLWLGGSEQKPEPTTDVAVTQPQASFCSKAASHSCPKSPCCCGIADDMASTMDEAPQGLTWSQSVLLVALHFDRSPQPSLNTLLLLLLRLIK